MLGLHLTLEQIAVSGNNYPPAQQDLHQLVSYIENLPPHTSYLGSRGHN